MKIYLASKSPRRQELLTQMAVPFELLLVDTPEVVGEDETPRGYSMRITKDKLEAAVQIIHQEGLPLIPVLCADTEVILDHEILGKAPDYQAAFDMLKKLSGRKHSVITSVGLKFKDYQKIEIVETIVTFEIMTDKDIHRYLETGNYEGKSGSYGIQSYIGQFISHIDGCFYSVMGLPLNGVRALLADMKAHSQKV